MKIRSSKYYAEKGIQAAQEQARDEGIAIGSLVYHPSIDLIFSLREIKENIAIGYIPAEESPTGKEIIKEFPRDEILDPKVAMSMAKQLKEQDIILNKE